jgi:hypothetical protein
MQEDGRAFHCEPCRQIIIFFAVSDASPYVAATIRQADDRQRGPVGHPDLTGARVPRPARQRTDVARC